MALTQFDSETAAGHCTPIFELVSSASDALEGETRFIIKVFCSTGASGNVPSASPNPSYRFSDPLSN